MNNRGKLSARAGQKGFALSAALVFAVILLLLGTAVAKKSFNSNNEVMGATFRQSAANGGDGAMLLATNWLSKNASGLPEDNPEAGYYAEEMKDVDWTGMGTPSTSVDDVNWDGSNEFAALQAYKVPADPSDKSGNAYQYVIQRRCGSEGLFTVISSVACMTHINTSFPVDCKQGESSGGSGPTMETMLYYRITVRAYNAEAGAASYTQSLMLVSAEVGEGGSAPRRVSWRDLSAQ